MQRPYEERAPRQIAERLVLSVRTVDVHVEHVLRKLDVGNRTTLAALAGENLSTPRRS